MLTEMTTDAARPFYRLGSLLFVGPIPREEFIQFLLDSFARGGFRVEGATGKETKGGTVNLILDLAEEVVAGRPERVGGVHGGHHRAARLRPRAGLRAPRARFRLRFASLLRNSPRQSLN